MREGSGNNEKRHTEKRPTRSGHPAGPAGMAGPAQYVRCYEPDSLAVVRRPCGLPPKKSGVVRNARRMIY